MTNKSFKLSASAVARLPALAARMNLTHAAVVEQAIEALSNSVLGLAANQRLKEQPAGEVQAEPGNMTIKELSLVYNIPPSTISAAIRSGRLSARLLHNRRGRRVYYINPHSQQFRRFLAGHLKEKRGKVKKSGSVSEIGLELDLG